MAKDGTNRGGARIGAGAKKKPLADKIAEGNPGKRTLTVIDFDNQSVDLEGQAMPKPSKLLSAKQKDGKKLVAADIYKKTWDWLHERGCAALVSPQLLERYSMSVARWIQCEEAITEFGFLAKHPTTGNAIQSPYRILSNAKAKADENTGYSVFDNDGNVVYTPFAAKVEAETKPGTAFEPYRVRIRITNLNIRKGPGTNYDKTGQYTGAGVFTIIAESDGEGATKWGKLKSGAGWISLDYAKII